MAKMKIEIKKIIFVLCWFMPIFSQAQTSTKGDFIPPINLPFNLAGTFGEPRLHHFHSGIDIKTNGIEGVAVVAIADGYISRIRVSPFGYGKAIYITHNNGYTSVYGHLSKFYGAIEQYIHQQHYAQQKNELDLFLSSSQFPIKQGDTIAYSGNTGGSSAPHLHFEIRNSKTEIVLNPLDFYPKSMYIDSLVPTITMLNVLQENVDTIQHIQLIQQENFLTTTQLIYVNDNAYFYFSLDGFDKQNATTNKNGIKKIEVYQNEKLVFKFDVTTIDFSNTRMCDAFVDYDALTKDEGYYYNCFRLKGNTLPIYSKGNGFYKLMQRDTANFTFKCYDYNENATIIKIKCIAQKNKNTKPTFSKTSNSLFIKDIAKEYKIANKTTSLNFPSNTFYEKTCLHYQEIKPNKKEQLSNIFKVINKNKEVPLFKSASIKIQSNSYYNKNKILIARENFDGSIDALKTTINGNTFSANTKDLGTFYLVYDTIAPQIIIDSSSINSSSIQAKIIDSLSGIDSYNGYIDGHWINFYYDAKNDTIEYKMDEYCTKGEHTLLLKVSDEVGNSTSTSFQFKKE